MGKRRYRGGKNMGLRWDGILPAGSKFTKLFIYIQGAHQNGLS